MNSKTKDISLLGVLCALAIVLAYLEALLPPISAAFPGIKMGLPNIVIVFILYRLGTLRAAAVSLVRLVVVSALFGSAVSFIYGLSGAMLSLCLMAILRKLDFFSSLGVSIAGAVAHNIGQILAAIVLLGRAEIAYYLPVLLLSGTVAGAVVGLCCALVLKKTQHIHTDKK